MKYFQRKREDISKYIVNREHNTSDSKTSALRNGLTRGKRKVTILENTFPKYKEKQFLIISSTFDVNTIIGFSVFSPLYQNKKHKILSNPKKKVPDVINVENSKYLRHSIKNPTDEKDIQILYNLDSSCTFNCVLS